MGISAGLHGADGGRGEDVTRTDCEVLHLLLPGAGRFTLAKSKEQSKKREQSKLEAEKIPLLFDSILSTFTSYAIGLGISVGVRSSSGSVPSTRVPEPEIARVARRAVEARSQIWGVVFDGLNVHLVGGEFGFAGEAEELVDLMIGEGKEGEGM